MFFRTLLVVFLGLLVAPSQAAAHGHPAGHRCPPAHHPHHHAHTGVHVQAYPRFNAGTRIYGMHAYKPAPPAGMKWYYHDGSHEDYWFLAPIGTH